jgi:glutaredoxin 3
MKRILRFSTPNQFFHIKRSNDKMKLIVITGALLLPFAFGYAPNPVISAAAKGMGLLAPIFKAEAAIQAATLGAISNVNKDDVVNEINEAKAKNKVLIYTYTLSPFSSEAVKILESTGKEFTEIPLGPEWFLLGGKESVARVVLSEEVENGATSLPKIFIGGKCIGGCDELTSLAKSGELETVLSSAFSSSTSKKTGFSFPWSS